MRVDIAHSSWLRRGVAGSAISAASMLVAGFGPMFSAAAAEAPVPLRSATSYAVLADGSITNNGNSVIAGDVGVHPGNVVSGFPPGVVNGARHAGDGAAQQAQADLDAAYTDAVGRGSTGTTGADLGGQTFTSGVFTSPGNVNLNGTVTLDAQGDANAVFIFQLGSTLSTAANSNVQVINSPGPACNVFWAVGNSVTLGSQSTFVGRIMSVNSITLNSTARIEPGGALARNGPVTLNNNVVSRGGCAGAAGPAPSATTPLSPTPTATPSTTAPATPSTPSNTAPRSTPPTTAPAAPTTAVPTTAAPATEAPTVAPPTLEAPTAPPAGGAAATPAPTTEATAAPTTPAPPPGGGAGQGTEQGQGTAPGGPGVPAVPGGPGVPAVPAVPAVPGAPQPS
jgi:hypothetical protein